MGKVGEDGNFDRDAEGAELDESVGGGFEDEEFGTGVGDGTDALVEDFDAFGGHVFKLFMEKSGVEAGVGDFVFVAINSTPSGGGEEAGAVAGVTKHFPDHKTGSGFAVGAGDGDDAEVLRGVVVFAGGGEGLEPVEG